MRNSILKVTEVVFDQRGWILYFMKSLRGKVNKIKS